MLKHFSNLNYLEQRRRLQNNIFSIRIVANLYYFSLCCEHIKSKPAWQSQQFTCYSVV